jgi:hypothetical protein
LYDKYESLASFEFPNVAAMHCLKVVLSVEHAMNILLFAIFIIISHSSPWFEGSSEPNDSLMEKINETNDNGEKKRLVCSVMGSSLLTSLGRHRFDVNKIRWHEDMVTW